MKNLLTKIVGSTLWYVAWLLISAGFVAYNVIGDNAGRSAFWGSLMGFWLTMLLWRAADVYVDRQIAKARADSQISGVPCISADRYEEAIAAFYAYNTAYNNTQENSK